ncbi:MAG: hypothetical protein Q8O67_11255 [Deltaproteobacteria bacterium]|nr:hypothetical protein [Deltaproteobacteria bacterium]
MDVETALVSEPDADLISDTDRLCAADDDCVIVDESCCPCTGNGSNRGKTAVAATAVADIDARRAASCSGLCAAALSNNDTCCASAAICVHGRCEVKGVAGRTLGNDCQ